MAPWKLLLGSYKSKLSFQYGFSVFLLTVVVLVCSPLMVATANGSGKPAVVSCLISDRVVCTGTYGRHLSCRVHRRR